MGDLPRVRSPQRSKALGAWRGLLLWLAAIFAGLALVTWLLGRLAG